jgi:hypothetical protein
MELIPISVWKQAWGRPRLRTGVYLTVPLFILVLLGLTRFLDYVEQRPGAVLSDPLLSIFAPLDLTWVTFTVIYVGLLGGVFFLVRHPRSLLLAIQGYTLMALLRMLGMFLLPLEPPATMIPLRDPFVEFFGTGQVLTKDLFFSGHTSTLFLLCLVAPTRSGRMIFLSCTVVVAACVLVQHVHYTIDVFAAPVFAYAAYRIAAHFDRERG